MTRQNAYGYVVPLPTDPVRDGATVMANLGDALRAPEMFTGMSPWAGQIPSGGHKNIKHVVIQGWNIGTDQYGLVTIPAPFTTVLLACQIQCANFRDVARGSALNPESKGVSFIGAMIFKDGGVAASSAYVTLQVDLWGY